MVRCLRQVDETPVPAAGLGGFELVFDAVYTPLHTRLLREAEVRSAKLTGLHCRSMQEECIIVRCGPGFEARRACMLCMLPAMAL